MAEEKNVEQNEEKLVNLSEGTGKKEHDQQEFEQILREQNSK